MSELLRLRNQCAAALLEHTVVGGRLEGVKIYEHGGALTLKEIRRYAMQGKVGAIAVAIDRAPTKPIGTQVVCSAHMIAYVAVPNKPERADMALAIVDALLNFVPRWPGKNWGVEAKSPASVDAMNLYDSEKDDESVALWAVVWEQDIFLRTSPAVSYVPLRAIDIKYDLAPREDGEDLGEEIEAEDLVWLHPYVARRIVMSSAGELVCDGYVEAANTAPSVNAGIDQTIAWEDRATVQLSGSATDDGSPAPPAALTYLWEQISGPGTAVFADATDPNTECSLDVAGDYVLRLTASDSALTAYDESEVRLSWNPTASSAVLWGVPAFADLAFNGPAVDGGLVSAIDDRASLDNDLLQSVTADQPLWSIGPPASLVFAGGTDRMLRWITPALSGIPIGSHPYFFAVVKIPYGDNNVLTINATAGGVNGLLMGTTAAGKLQARTRVGGATVTCTSTDSMPNDVFCYVEAWIDAATLNVAINGGTATSVALADTNGIDDAAEAGWLGHNAVTAALVGRIYEFGAFADFSAAGTQVFLREYMQEQHGL